MTTDNGIEEKSNYEHEIRGHKTEHNLSYIDNPI